MSHCGLPEPIVLSFRDNALEPPRTTSGEFCAPSYLSHQHILPLQTIESTSLTQQFAHPIYDSILLRQANLQTAFGHPQLTPSKHDFELRKHIFRSRSPQNDVFLHHAGGRHASHGALLKRPHGHQQTRSVRQA